MLGVVNVGRSRVQKHDVDQNGEQDYGVILNFSNGLQRSFVLRTKRSAPIPGTMFRRGIATARLEHTYTWTGTADYSAISVDEIQERLYNSATNGDDVFVLFGAVQVDGEYIARDVHYNSDLLFVGSDAFEVVARDNTRDIAELGTITGDLTDGEVIRTVATRIGATIYPQPPAPPMGRALGGNAGIMSPARLTYNDMVGRIV